MFQQLPSGENGFEKDIAVLNKLQEASESYISAFGNAILEINATFSDLKAKCGKIKTIQISMQSAERTLGSYKSKFADLEDRSHGSNLVVLGLLSLPVKP